MVTVHTLSSIWADKRLTISFWQVFLFQKVKTNTKDCIPVFSSVIRTKHYREKKLNPYFTRGKVRLLLMFLGNLLATAVIDPNRGTQKRWHLTGIMWILGKYKCQATILCTSRRKNNWVYIYLPVRVSKINKGRRNFALKTLQSKISHSSKSSSLKINYNTFICQFLIQTSRRVALLFLAFSPQTVGIRKRLYTYV